MVPPSSSPAPSAPRSNRNLFIIVGAILGLCLCGACVAAAGSVFVLPAFLTTPTATATRPATPTRGTATLGTA